MLVVLAQISPSIEFFVSFIKYFSSRISIWLYGIISRSLQMFPVLFLYVLNIVSIDVLESVFYPHYLDYHHHHRGSISVHHFFWYSVTFSSYFFSTIFVRNITLLCSLFE